MVLLLGGWEAGKIEKQTLEEASVTLGISIEDLDNEEHAPKLLRLSAEKFSTELFKNRISDFCGVIRTAWGWLANIAQALVIITVLWYTITDNTDNAVYAWFIPAIYMFSWLVSVVFSLTCKLLTGRYPGQAKTTRKLTAEWVQNNSESLGATNE